MRPLLCGYYGEHNIGDDLLLQALLNQLPVGCQPLVTAHDEAEVRARFRVPTCQRRSLATVITALGRCDALVLGGGSLLQDSTSFNSLLYYAALIMAARFRRLPVLLWGQGLGPLRRRRSRALVRALLPLVQGISWRDGASAAMAARWGRSAPVGADPVWSLPPSPWQGEQGPLVLCWRRTPLLDVAGWRHLLHAVDQLASLAGGREVIWLPFHRDQDRGLLAWLQEQTLVPEPLARRSREVELGDADGCRTLFAGAGLVLAMRLHGLILAAVAGAPCVALSYDPKVAAAAGDLGCPLLDLAAAGPALTHAPAPASLAAGWADQLGQAPPAGRLAGLQQATAVHGELLQRWLSSGAQVASPKAT